MTGATGAAGVGAGTGCDSCQFEKAAIAAWVVGEGPRCGSVEKGEAAGCWAGVEKGAGAVAAGAGAISKGDAAKARGGASNPKPSEGSATWKGESAFRRSGSLAGLPGSTDRESGASSMTVKGES